MKNVFYNATVHNKLDTFVEGICNEEDLINYTNYKLGDSWEDFYWALKVMLIHQQGGYHVTMNQFSKLSD